MSSSQLHLELFQTDRRGPAPGQHSANIQVATVCPFSRSYDFTYNFSRTVDAQVCPGRELHSEAVADGNIGQTKCGTDRAPGHEPNPDPKPSRRTVAKTDTVEQQAPLNKYSWHIRNQTLSSMADPRKAILRTKNIALCAVARLSNSGARTPRQTEAHGKCRRPDLGDPETHRLGACFPLIGALGSPNLSTASSPPS